jgi:hypothetical protein
MPEVILQVAEEKRDAKCLWLRPQTYIFRALMLPKIPKVS